MNHLLPRKEHALATHKSAMKRARQSIRRKIFHNQYKGQIKALEKIFLSSIAKKDKSSAEKNLKTLITGLDKACQKGYFHKNKSARKKSTFSRLFNSL